MWEETWAEVREARVAERCAADLHEELSHQLQRLREAERALGVGVRRRMRHHVQAGLHRAREGGDGVAVADRAAHLLAAARVDVL